VFPLHQKAAARKDSQSKFGEFGPIQRLVTVTIGQAVCLRIVSELTSTSMTWSPPYSSAAGLSSPVDAALFPAATSGGWPAQVDQQLAQRVTHTSMGTAH